MDEPAPPSSALPTVAVLLAALLALCALSGGAVWLWARFRPPNSGDLDAGVGVEAPAQQPALDDAGISAQDARRQLEEARRAMQGRYRPGPFVRVEGLLPAGLSDLRRHSMGASARTVDTPWIVPGAELRAASTPAASGGPALRLSRAADEALEVIPGTPSTLGVTSDDELVGFWLTFEGYPGSFWLPTHASTELGLVHVAGSGDATLAFGVDSPTLPNGAAAPADKPFDVMLSVAAQDAAGHVSAPVTRRLSVLPLGTGDVEVSLSMTEATDLDLYVVDPTGAVLYYGRQRVGTGGQLDLDANAACGSNMGVNAEHVYWPPSAAPAGTYHVRVANYESCIDGGPVDYRVTVRACGETAVFSGRFSGEGDERECFRDPGQDRVWCQHVVSFDVDPCKR